MRHLVNKKSYRWRKFIDDFLVSVFPKSWIPLYNSVSFTLMPYTQCVQNRTWQDNVINLCIKISEFLFKNQIFIQQVLSTIGTIAGSSIFIITSALVYQNQNYFNIKMFKF